MDRSKSLGFGQRNTPDIAEDNVSANSRRSAAVAGLFGASAEKSDVNI